MGVYESRVNAGRILAKTHPVEADLVVGVPESGNPAALGYSMESGIPYGNAFIKNNYVGRTFIKPKQEQRESSVKVKLKGNVLMGNPQARESAYDKSSYCKRNNKPQESFIFFSGIEVVF